MTPCGLDDCEYVSLEGLRIRTFIEPGILATGTEEAADALTVQIQGMGQGESDGQSFNWDHTREAGGITVYSTKGRLNVVQIQNCTERRWRRCSNAGARHQGGAIHYFRSIIRNGE